MKMDTFDSQSFVSLKKAEKHFFWFVVRRKWVFDKLKKFIVPPAKLLEVGCGTGNVSSFLAKKGYNVTGCELFPEALDLAWPGFEKVLGDATNLPFEDNTFDIVGLFDVIEHFQDDIGLIKEAARVVKKGGLIAVTVPARDELWSRFDELSFHKRRYAIESLRAVLLNAGLKPCYTSYIFMFLYIPMRYLRGQANDSGSFKINPVLNLLAMGFFEIERYASKLFNLPVGTSLIAIAQK